MSENASPDGWLATRRLMAGIATMLKWPDSSFFCAFYDTTATKKKKKKKKKSERMFPHTLKRSFKLSISDKTSKFVNVTVFPTADEEKLTVSVR